MLGIHKENVGREEIPVHVHSSLYIQTSFESFFHGIISCQAFPVLPVSEASVQVVSQQL